MRAIMNYTTIRITADTRDRLTKNKIVKREMYDEVINRALDMMEESKSVGASIAPKNP